MTGNFQMPKNKAYKILKMEGKFVLDTNGLLFRHTYIGKWSVNQLIVPKNWIVPKNELLDWYHDHIACSHLLLLATLELTKPTRKSDLLITGICLLVYKCGFTHVFCVHKRKEIIIIKLHYCQLQYQDLGKSLQQIAWHHYLLLPLAIDILW